MILYQGSGPSSERLEVPNLDPKFETKYTELMRYVNYRGDLRDRGVLDAAVNAATNRDERASAYLVWGHALWRDKRPEDALLFLERGLVCSSDKARRGVFLGEMARCYLINEFFKEVRDTALECLKEIEKITGDVSIDALRTEMEQLVSTAQRELDRVPFKQRLLGIFSRWPITHSA